MKRPKPLIIAAVVLIVLIIVLALLASGPSHGKIKPAAQPASASKSAGLSYANWRGKTIAFDKLTNYTSAQVLKPDGNAAEQANWVRHGEMAASLSLEVVKLPTGKPTDESSYILRTTNPQTYKRSTVTVLGSPAEVFGRDDDPERVLYVRRGSLMAVLAFKSGQLDTLDDQLKRAAATFAWTGGGR